MASLPKIRRQYKSIFGLDAGLDYSKPSTMIDEKGSAKCGEVVFRRHTVGKSKGVEYFAGTDTSPLLGIVMHVDQFYKTTGVDKLIIHTTTDVYSYDTTHDRLDNITRGVVVEDCEDAWTASANVTATTDGDVYRRGSKSAKIVIAAAFTTGVVAYEDFSSADLSTYDNLHFWIRANRATTATELDVRVSEENAGGTGASYEDISVPALSADTWTECSIAFAGAGTTRDAVLSISLINAVDTAALTIYLDDVRATIPLTGNADNDITSDTHNNYYLHNNGIEPVEYWDMSTDTVTALAGCSTLATKCMGRFGERVIFFHVVDNGTAYPQRVQWTVVGGVSVPPAATDWTGSGSGNTDLEGIMGVDFIKSAQKIGNYFAIYGERTIVLMDYTGRASSPFSFYTRVSGIGLPAAKAIVNLGNEHIFLGWDDVYSYKGGKDVERIGGNIRDELFKLVVPEYINRCFMVYIEETDEISLYYPTTTDTTPTKFFKYNLENRSWSSGERSYTSFGYYSKVSAPTWNTIGNDADATWDEQALSTRWDDATLEALAPINLFGDTSGIVYQNSEMGYNIIDSAIDGYWETKDFVTGERYRAEGTAWMELTFEGRGDSVDVSYSVDKGVSWSDASTQELVNGWETYSYDFEAYSDVIRFRFRNNTLNETFEIRQIEIGFIPLSNRGV